MYPVVNPDIPPSTITISTEISSFSLSNFIGVVKLENLDDRFLADDYLNVKA